MRRCRWVSLLPIALLGAACYGCGSRAGAIGAVVPETLSRVAVAPKTTDAELFASETLAVLGSPQASPETLRRLVGVVRFQLERAENLFAAGQDEAALGVLEGALLLVRVGELRTEMFTGLEGALIQGAAAVARRGDEGRAEALYHAALSSLPPSDPRRALVQSHLEALAAWQQATRGGSVRSLEVAHTAAVGQLILEPRVEVLEEARRLTNAWMVEAIELRDRGEVPTTQAEEDERLSAERAYRMGPTNLVASFLRSGDAAGAAAELEAETNELPLGAALARRLEEAADGNAEAWAALLSFYLSSAPEGPQTDPLLSRAAAFGTAIQLHRAEPEELRWALPLAGLLVDEFGMGEVMPLLVGDALLAESNEKAFGVVLRMLGRAVVRAESSGEPEVARRTYRNSVPILSAAARLPHDLELRPEPADIEHLMGAMESREGNLKAAREHLERAVVARPTRDALRLLSAIELHDNNIEGALRSAHSMEALASAAQDFVGVARALLVEQDILVRASRHGGGDALERARVAVDRAREEAHSGAELAFAEATLAEIFERRGLIQEAEAATDRAVEAARNSSGPLAAALQDAARRALTWGDLPAARGVLRRAIDLALDPETLLYITVWTALCEERQHATSDGSVAEGLMAIRPPNAWTGALRDWLRGRKTSEQLRADARSFVQRVEADFYIALREHFQTPTPATHERLQEIAQSDAIELVEVRMARELTAHAAAQ